MGEMEDETLTIEDKTFSMVTNKGLSHHTQTKRKAKWTIGYCIKRVSCPYNIITFGPIFYFILLEGINFKRI